MDYVARLHLKTNTCHRQEMVDFCLNNSEQYVAIGWSRLSEGITSDDFREYYNRIKQENGKANPAINIFRNAKVDDLLWTRDLNGNYWICKVKSPVKVVCDKRMDIGALIPVEAYNFGMQVPGQIKASFTRINGGTAGYIRDGIIVEYSKLVFNQLSQSNYYQVIPYVGGLLDNLPDFDLEELVISYLQVKENYYVLSNSIAKNSTTIKIECEMMSRDVENPRKAVVQVKGKKARELNALDFKQYVEEGYIVYLHAPKISNLDQLKNVVRIYDSTLLDFYEKNKPILPASITQWEDLFR
ncbi:ribonuclease D [Streptococcus koreensis]|nr:ribonuclease D [Streptococcus koreensis]